MKSNLLPIAVIAFVLATLGGLGWLGRHPELIGRAADWPWVGDWAADLHERLTPPGRRDPRGAPAAPGAAPGSSPESPPPSAAGGLAAALPQVWVLPGVELRRAPEPAADVLYTFGAIANVGRLDRRGDWFQVRYRDLEGWVLLEDYQEGGDPPYGEAPEPPGPLPPQAPDARKLAAALEVLKAERRGRLGPYDLYTDVEEQELLAHLGRLAEDLDTVYRERYGRAPLGEPKAAVVLFAGEGGYRVLELRTERIAGLEASGHNSHGVAALFVGRRPWREVASTLVHELVHLINRRALGPALPPWIDEGLADDLALSKADGGRLDPWRLGGGRIREGGQIFTVGGYASLLRLQEALREGRLPRLEELVGLDWQGFVVSPRSRLHYAQSAFWVRFLLEAEDGRRAAALRGFLDAVAGGGEASGEALRARLGESWEALDEAFRAWLRSYPMPEARAAGSRA